MEHLSVGKTAKLLGVSVDVVRSLEESGELKAIRTGGGHRRFRSEDVERLRARWRAKHSKSLVTRSKGSAPRSATPPIRQSRPVEPEPDYFGFEDEIPEVDVQRAVRDAEREEARQRAETEAKTQAAAAVAERQRLEDLKKYGRDVATWSLLPIEWRARVVEDLEEFVTSKRLPSSLAPWEAQQIVKG